MTVRACRTARSLEHVQSQPVEAPLCKLGTDGGHEQRLTYRSVTVVIDWQWSQLLANKYFMAHGTLEPNPHHAVQIDDTLSGLE